MSNVLPLKLVGAIPTEMAAADSLAVPLNVITDATAARVLALTDGNAYIRMTSASANTVTVPPNSSVAFPIGAQVHVRNAGSGTTTIAAGTGVTINNPSTLVLAATGTVSLVKVGTDTWDLFGLTT